MERKQRYLQIAFNGGLASALRVLSTIEFNERILIEAGTPFIKLEGVNGIRALAQIWPGIVVADLKTMDGAVGEVALANFAGARAATAMGSASVETLNLFIEACKSRGMISMIDMLNVEEPLKVLMQLRIPPEVVIIHKGRDEESTRGKMIKYKHINKIRSKYDVLISAAGGVNLREARSAIFNGANIVVVNIVGSDDPWEGIDEDDDVAEIAKKFLSTIE